MSTTHSFLKKLFRKVDYLGGNVIYSLVLYLYLKPAYLFAGIKVVTHFLQGCASQRATKQILKSFGAKIGDRKVRLGPYLYIHNADLKDDFSNLIVGEDVYIGPYVVLDLSDTLVFENHTALGMYCQIFTHSTFTGTYGLLYASQTGSVVFEEFSGANPGAIVLAGVRIGKHSYITPGSVVTKDVPPCVIVRGNPAEKIAALPENVMRSYEHIYRGKVFES